MLDLIEVHIFLMAIACAGLFLAGILKGLTGVGFTTCALPILALGLELKIAVCLAAFSALAACLVVSRRALHFGETVRRFGPLYIAISLGIIAGLTLQSHLTNAYGTRVLGWITLGYAIFAITKPDLYIAQRLERRLQLPVGLANGLITGVTGSQIIPLVPYLMALRLDAGRLLQAVNTSVIIGSVVMLVGLLLGNTLTVGLITISFIGIVPATLGVYLGDYLRRRLSSPHFRSVMISAVGLLGIALLTKP